MLGAPELDAELPVWSPRAEQRGRINSLKLLLTLLDTTQQLSFWTAVASGLSSNRAVIWPDPRIKGLTLGNTQKCLSTPLLSLLHGRQRAPTPWTENTSKMPPSQGRGAWDTLAVHKCTFSGGLMEARDKQLSQGPMACGWLSTGGWLSPHPAGSSPGLVLHAEQQGGEEAAQHSAGWAEMLCQL